MFFLVIFVGTQALSSVVWFFFLFPYLFFFISFHSPAYSSFIKEKVEIASVRPWKKLFLKFSQYDPSGLGYVPRGVVEEVLCNVNCQLPKGHLIDLLRAYHIGNQPGMEGFFSHTDFVQDLCPPPLLSPPDGMGWGHPTQQLDFTRPSAPAGSRYTPNGLYARPLVGGQGYYM